MERNKIIPPKKNSLAEEDRLKLAALLLKAGFAVKIKKEKNGSTTAYYVEYWEEGE